MSPLSAVQMGGYATSITHSKSEQVWISTLPIRWFVSKCSLKVFDFCSHFSLSYRKAHHKGCIWKKRTDLLCFWLTFITKGQIVLVYSSLGKQHNKMEHPLCLRKFSSGKACLQRLMMSHHLYTRCIYSHDGKSWDLQVSMGLKPKKPCRSPQPLCYQLLLGNIYSSNHFLSHTKTGMNRVDLWAARKIIYALSDQNLLSFVVS